MRLENSSDTGFSNHSTRTRTWLTNMEDMTNHGPEFKCSAYVLLTGILGIILGIIGTLIWVLFNL